MSANVFLLLRSGLSYWHQPGSDPLNYLTLGQMMEETALRFGQRDAVVSVEEQVRLTYRELLEQVRLLMGLL